MSADADTTALGDATTSEDAADAAAAEAAPHLRERGATGGRVVEVVVVVVASDRVAAETAGAELRGGRLRRGAA